MKFVIFWPLHNFFVASTNKCSKHTVVLVSSQINFTLRINSTIYLALLFSNKGLIF